MTSQMCRARKASASIMYTPTDEEVARAIADARAMALLRDETDAGLHVRLKDRHPEWTLSAKVRFMKLLYMCSDLTPRIKP